MRRTKFIMDFRLSHHLFKKEMSLAYNEPYPEYYRFLKDIGFTDFIHHVTTSVVAYPYSVEACHDSLSDLAYSMHDSLSKRRLSQQDQNRLSRLVELCGNEIIKIFESFDFFHNRSNNSPDEYDAIVAIPDVRRISTFTFQVKIREENQDSDIHDLLSHSDFEPIQPRQWTH